MAGAKDDPIVRLIDVLHDLQLAHIESMSDEVLKSVNELMLMWHELISQEEDKRALAKGPPR
jgi:hypothetical protein